MCLIDECSNFFYNEFYDKNAKYSSKGKINNKILQELMLDKYINKPPPKSTGRNDFGLNHVISIKDKYPDILPNDLLPTFCKFTAKSIASNLKKFLNFNCLETEMIISGGGVYHPILMQDLKKSISIDQVKVSDTFGIKSDMKESLLMAALGVAKINSVPANMPSVTGANDLTLLGNIYK